MLQFYKTYKDNEKVTPLVTQLSWTNNLLILSNCKTEEEREFYLNLSIKENYSKRELDRQLQSSYYQRYMLSEGKQLPSMTKTIDEDDYPNTRILDTYTLEFLDMPNNFSEKELKNGIIKNMKDFILEIGKDFTFISEEYKVQVGNHDFFIDLLFYNRELSCLVAFEFASWLSPEFKLYLITEFERLKTNEAFNEKIDWEANRLLSKLNYVVHTDAIKTHIVPTLTENKKDLFMQLKRMC